MALFNQFPWTNLHELNLDWIIKKIKNLETIGRILPDDGTDGQVLKKSGAGSVWQNAIQDPASESVYVFEDGMQKWLNAAQDTSYLGCSAGQVGWYNPANFKEFIKYNITINGSSATMSAADYPQMFMQVYARKNVILYDGSHVYHVAGPLPTSAGSGYVTFHAMIPTETGITFRQLQSYSALTQVWTITDREIVTE